MQAVPMMLTITNEDKTDKDDRDSRKRTSEERHADDGQRTYQSAALLLGLGIMRRNPAACSNVFGPSPAMDSS